MITFAYEFISLLKDLYIFPHEIFSTLHLHFEKVKREEKQVFTKLPDTGSIKNQII